MALRLYSSASFDSTTGKTLVGVKEADERETVLFIATLDGDHTGVSDAELIKLAVDWFTLKYVKDFSDQLLNDKINEANKVISEIQSQAALTAESASKAEAERNERFEKLEATVNKAVSELTTLMMNLLAGVEHTEEEHDEKSVG
ncbi:MULTISPECIES: hypothetical protein [unclassified Streptococcus]|uniref:hypothetical protein n=1 Tax=unclassified Streptococcus TaxID=2608887 RepID=UPI00211B5803|nr:MULTISPECIES: hypothetical protein [unclassified Streptococcus]MCQ9211810.1 hypothetical protein [Streptococcus sp. B01]MCQ9212841.1 hypothetical protein [Streptococcus sp. B01]MCQ9212930.1 hypothetical protein [Streptococcus sp. O1]MCQ9215006.1 hypothetical protein [Streptococcus sp. O1]